jgi:hypothetical protein
MRPNDSQRSALDPPRDPDQEVLAQRLRTLATEMRPPFGCGEFERRMRERGQRRASERLVGFAGLAAAAALVALVLVAEWLVAERHPGVRVVGPLGERGVTEEPLSPPGPAGLDPEERAARADLIAREPAIVRVSTRLAVTGLEDRIASLDDVLNSEQLRNAHDPRLSALRRERAQMLSSLEQVRYAEDLAAELP